MNQNRSSEIVHLVPVILSGGSGSRLWPLSREAYPKHLIPLFDQKTLFQETLLRLKNIRHQDPVVVCNEKHRFMVAEQMRTIGVTPQSIILEPVARNTAPAVAVAALQALKTDPDAILLIQPADHVFKQCEVLRKAITDACLLANSGKLVTFGIAPNAAHTGYGYIRRGQSLGGSYTVDSFVEKPDRKLAKQYLSSGEYYWNSGILVCRADRYLQEFHCHQSESYSFAKQSIDQAVDDLDFLRLDPKAFSKCEDISFDYAIMEHTQDAVVIPLDAGWNDVGSWSSLAEVFPHDDDGNVIQGDVVTLGVTNSYLHSQGRLLAAIGLDGYVVVETSDALLVAPKESTQSVKKIVTQLRKNHRNEHLHHLTQYRPWGEHELLIDKAGFQVRRVIIRPGMAIDRQIHQFRTEHWIVVKGEATIMVGNTKHLVKQNESFFVEKGQIHQISNVTDKHLEFIEVQVGECIKEDDIERFRYDNHQEQEYCLSPDNTVGK